MHAHFDNVEERIDRLEKTVAAAVDLLHRLLHPEKRGQARHAREALMSGAMRPLGPLACVVGARPNYMKMAPLVRAFAARAGRCRASMLVHTGQHYDVAMNERLFADLELPAPDLNLEVGSGTHAVQTAEIMRRFEPVLDELAPSCVIVVGDVNSTLACSLVASKKRMPVVHVEAGLRSFDRDMPEEINRVLTDQIADLLYTTERVAADNLAREGIDRERVRFVGNVMIDSLLRHQRAGDRADGYAGCARGRRGSFAGGIGGFGVVTLASAVERRRAAGAARGADDPARRRRAAAAGLAGASAREGQHRALRACRHCWPARASRCCRRRVISKCSACSASARLVLTDSGGIQEETTALAVPCLTMRDNTERPITVEQGTNTLVGRNRARTLDCVDEILDERRQARPDAGAVGRPRRRADRR